MERTEKTSGYIEGGLMLAFVVVLVGSVILVRYREALPHWAKVAAVIVALVVLGAGWWYDRTSQWPPLDKLPSDEGYSKKDIENENSNSV